MSNIRVRFAPSPTGPLHIGGVRTALYNYLFAKKNNGTFILRIEDTDQTRYVPGAEQYIIDSLKWTGLIPDEGPGFGGTYGPYRQSERKEMYRAYAEQLIELGHAYYAFDSAEELDKARETGGEEFKYNYATRTGLKNSLSLSKEETATLLEKNENVVIRLKIPQDVSIKIQDNIRGEVTFNSNELDDKVILKGDGMPTYHLANIVDDHLMGITHVIRGEEWLPSTAHHQLMYDFFGWQAPQFAHLPLILKPTGAGKLSKRDGAKFGFPVFPLNWDGSDGDGAFPGFKEEGFLKEALINFIAFLGWNPGTDEEILSMQQLIDQFSIERIGKSGSRFDYEKAKWYNQQYLIMMSDGDIASLLIQWASEYEVGFYGHKLIAIADKHKLAYAAKMMKERVYFLQDIILSAPYLFSKPLEIDQPSFDKKYKSELATHFLAIADLVAMKTESGKELYETAVKQYISDHQLKMGDILPILRLALTGTLQGPDLFETFDILGGKESSERIKTLINQHA